MATTTTKPARGKRAGVPAVDQATSSTSAIDALAAAPTTGLVEPIPLALLHPHPHNPRRDVGDITELADSIRAHGIRQNLLLVPDPDHPGEFRIVIGHRRAAGAADAGLDVVPAVVDSSLDEAGQLELMLMENLQRTDLTPVEEADGYQGLLDLGVDVKAIATRTGRAESTVRSRLRLAALPHDARAAVHEHRATLEDAAALDEFDDDPETRDALATVLGTRNFERELEAARQKASRRRALAPLMARLVEVGATQLDANVWGAPEGSRTAARVQIAYRVEGVDAALATLEDGTSEWSWRQYYSELLIFRPMTAEEVAAEQEAASAEPAWRVRQREADEARAAAEARWGEFTATTNATRRAFVLSVLRHKQLTKTQTEALVQHIGFELLTSALDDDLLYPDARSLPSWLDVDVDTIIDEAGGADEDGLVDAALGKAIAAMPPGHRLLVAAAAAIEPVPLSEWSHGVRRNIRTYYALLAALGYPVSDDEAAALAEGGASS